MMFWPKRYRISGDWRKFHSEEFYYLISLPEINQVIKSRKNIWVGHVVCVRVKRNTAFLWGNLMERDHLEDLATDGG